MMNKLMREWGTVEGKGEGMEGWFNGWKFRGRWRYP